MYVGDAAELARNKDRDRKNLRVRDKRHRQLAGNGKPTFKATLSPEGDSVASGLAKFWTNEDETELTFKLFVRDAEGLIGKAGAHLHCAPLGSNGGVVAFLASTLTGGLMGFLILKATLTDANVKAGGDCGDDVPALVNSIRDGNVYVNIHSNDNPSGDVRGQIA
eukprot:CAMPEP_0183766570 /NCGR_PEP_ID=MMETSP0739-20130205/11650_1 /TAXON_ID=385413 /ORGANISM="Thalassiosira miniscula, Strain CCMP1093" /LENGTH=164 /DNA_ID=CAMNT_0026005369 /DNA_START=198 /DNA_END=693 /DNA_ORIENTATION=-